MTRFLFIRHGETSYNKNNIIMGQKDISLNDKGISQAKKCGKYLQENYNISRIFSSDLKRAKETIEIIKEELKTNIKIEYYSALAERSFGDYEGMSRDEVFSKLTDSNGIYDLRITPPNGESELEFFKRVKKFLNEKINQNINKNDTILFLTHGGTLRFILGFFIYPNDQEYYNFPVNSKNCSITSISSDSSLHEKYIIDFINYYQYLNQQ